jgi:hypothetical protein
MAHRWFSFLEIASLLTLFALGYLFRIRKLSLWRRSGE